MSRTETLPSRAFAPQTSRLASLFQRPQEQGSTTKWPDPQKSTGHFVVMVGRDSIWEAIGPARDAFEDLAPNIKEYLEKSIEPIPCWVTWSLYMMGRAIGTASPTIIFCCEILKHRRNIRKAVKESGLLDKYPGFKTGHMQKPPDFDQLVDLAYGDASGTGENTVSISAKSSKSACGMRIFINGSAGYGSNWSKRATIGGVIQVEDKYYYTTASHPFSRGEDEDEDAFSFDGDSESSEVSVHTSVGQDPEDTETTAEEAASVYKPRSYYLGDQQIYSRRALQVSTRPTSDLRISDQEPLPPISMFPKTVSEPQGSLESIDTINLKSQVMKRNDSLDYALIEVEDPAHMAPNRFESGSNPTRSVDCKALGKSGYYSWPVTVVTARGSICGKLCTAPSYVLTPGSTSYCEARFARFATPLEEGDSGSWVVNEQFGKVFGHIVAGSPQKGMAVVVPFSAIFADIESKMGSAPRFPRDPAKQTRISPQEVKAASILYGPKLEADEMAASEGESGDHVEQDSISSLLPSHDGLNAKFCGLPVQYPDNPTSYCRPIGKLPTFQAPLPENPANQNPPCNTLYVGNLPSDASEDELRMMFVSQRGYRRMCYRTKSNGPMCFVEFGDIKTATRALQELYGRTLSNSKNGGIRLSFSKNPLGVRTTPGNFGGFNVGIGHALSRSTVNAPPARLGLSMPPAGLEGNQTVNYSSASCMGSDMFNREK